MSLKLSQGFGRNLAYKVRVTLPATIDIADYIAFIRDDRTSPVAAGRWVSGLESEIFLLCDNPGRFALIPEAEELGFAYRSFSYHSHRVIYAIEERQREVVIHRVYHSSRRALKAGDLSPD